IAQQLFCLVHSFPFAAAMAINSSAILPTVSLLGVGSRYLLRTSRASLSLVSIAQASARYRSASFPTCASWGAGGVGAAAHTSDRYEITCDAIVSSPLPI